MGSAYAYQKLCNHWSLEKLETIDDMVKKLKVQGFSKIEVEDASFRIAPSVLHVPFAIIGFTLKHFFSNEKLKRFFLCLTFRITHEKFRVLYY